MTIDDTRQFFAEEVRFAAPLRSQAVVDAFARVPRERFVGSGPWQIALPDFGAGATYVSTGDDDPRHVYHNVSIALDPARHLINGQPATIGRWIDELGIQPGERVFHLGCGPGYYTAIMAELAGSGGHVTAVDIDEALAARARTNLSAYKNVTVVAGDGASIDPGPCDAILINAGVPLPRAEWLDALSDSGRMIVPLTIPMGPTLGKGAVVKVTRQGSVLAARTIGLAVIYQCAGARNPQLDAALGKALTTGALMRLGSIRHDPHEPEDACVVHGSGVCLR